MGSTNVLADVSALSPEVLAFAAERGGKDYLPAVLAMTRRIYAGKPLNVMVEQDAEIADDRYIVFEVDVAGMAVAAMTTARRSWMAEIFQHCPSTHVHLLRLGIV